MSLDPAPRPRASRAWLWILPVLALAVAVRVLRVSEAARAPDFAQPAVDAGFHDWWARHAAGLELAEDPGRPPELLERPYLRPPGYPLFLAGVYRVFGPGYLAPRVVQAALGLLSVLAVWALGRRAFGELAGVLAALGLSIHWVIVYFESELQATALVVLLLLAAALALQRFGERPRALLACAGGCTLGAAALARPNALFVALFAAAWVGWVARRRGAQVLPSVLGLSFGVVLALLPATLRNAAAGDRVLISSNAGINLFIGNNPRADGFVAAHLAGVGRFETCFDYPALARRLERKTGRPLRDSEVSAWFAREAAGWMAAQPGAAARLAGRKTLLFFGPRVIAHNKELVVEREHSRVLGRLPGSFALLLGLALAGLFAGLTVPPRDGGGGDSPAPVPAPAPARERETAVLCAGVVLAWFLSVVPFFVAERYRVPVLPFLILLAAAGLAEAVRALRAGQLRRGGVILGAGAVLALASSWTPYHLPADPAKWHLDRGQALRRAGDEAAAVGELRMAVELDPESLAARRSLADALAASGRPRQAVAEYEAVLERRPNDARTLNNLGSVLAGLGEFERAVEVFERALRRTEDPATVHLNLARLHEAEGRPERAVEHLGAALQARPGWPPARRALLRLESGAAPADDAPASDPR